MSEKKTWLLVPEAALISLEDYAEFNIEDFFEEDDDDETIEVSSENIEKIKKIIANLQDK